MTKEKSIKIKKSDLWKYATFALLAVAIILGIMFFSGNCTGQAISEDEAGENLIGYLESIGYEASIIEIEKVSGMYYISFEYDGQESSVYLTPDGKNYVYGSLVSIIEEETTQPQQTILECAANYGLEEDTIIFYYSDSCGWCSKMKPGVDSLEQKGYNIYRAEASKADSLITNCVLGHLTSSGVPQFICVKTGEIKVGAFAVYDAEGNPSLDQEAMDAWAESCVAG